MKSLRSTLVLTIVSFALPLFSSCASDNAITTNASQYAAPSKPRVIATTDGEVDDRSTMIRFLLYTCDFDVAGIVEVNSKYQKNGHSKELWLQKELDAYAQVLPNLRKHKRLVGRPAGDGDEEHRRRKADH